MLNGGQVPVEDGAEAELRVAISQIEDETFTERMTVRGVIPILAKGTDLRVLLSIKDVRSIPEENRKHLTKVHEVIQEVGFVNDRNRYTAEACFLSVKLGEPTDRQMSSENLPDGGLWLIFEGSTPLEIRSSRIIIPQPITTQEAISLNHAFTILSEIYEPWRKSHTGSIYDRFFYQEKNLKWYPLGLLRDARKADQEQKVAQDLWKAFLERSKAPVSADD